MRFIEPLDGTMLLFTEGQRPAVRCAVEAGAGERVSINGVPCRAAGTRHEAELPLAAGRTELIATSDAGGRARSEVFRLAAPQKTYRLSLDDNIWFLQDLARNQGSYRSLFDNPYLGMYRDFHEKYGTKVHINVYNECPEHGGFALKEMPDKYRAEWERNRDWLRLSFHARANLPDQPYLDAGYDQVRGDCEQVQAELRRFYGEVGPVTTLHWAEATRDGIRALHDCGIRALLGDFSLDERGQPAICYSATPEQFDAVTRHCFWRDPETKMVFFPCEIVLNSHAPDEIERVLDRRAAENPGRNFIDILIHEQYFYPDYVNYLPDYRARVERGIQWCQRHGYSPGFVDDIFRGDYF